MSAGTELRRQTYALSSPSITLAYFALMDANLTLRAVRQELYDRLAAAGIDEARQEATWMIEAATGFDRLRQLTEADKPLPPKDVARLQDWLAERLSHKPLVQIIGWTVFYGLKLAVTPAVLSPRPETELLVELVSRTVPSPAPVPLIADLGTGSGAIALALAKDRPDLTLIGIDRSSEALTVARQNGQALGLTVDWRLGDWCSALHETERGRFAAIVSNPPYIPEAVWAELEPEVRDHEPATALVGGVDGLDPYRILPAQAFAYLHPGGLLAVEHGQGQGTAIADLFRSAGYVDVGLQNDYAGIDRIVWGFRP